MNQGARVAGAGRGEFEAILKICEALRDHTKDLIKSNAASWASPLPAAEAGRRYPY
jgi:hypothetical protein